MANSIPPSLFTAPDPMRVSNLQDFVQDYAPVRLSAVESPPLLADGAPGGDGVFVRDPVNYGGVYAPTFFNDWYFRVHFVPAALDLGNLLSNQNRDVVVWNAYLDAVDVTDFSLDAGDGIAVTEPAEVPFQMAPLGLYTYTVAVGTQGPPTINASMSWTIDGVDYNVPITGRRVVVWAFKPNWAQPVDETLEWRTAIETAFDRTEHRVAQRDEPRRVLEYRAQIVGPETALFESAMYGWADRLFALPIWQEKATLTEAALPGTLTLRLPVDDRSFVEDGLLVLFKNASTYEAIEIETVLDGEITLKKGTEFAWPVGASVFPVMIARFDGAANTNYVAEDKLEVPVRFVGSPADTPTRLPANEPAEVFDGFEVYTAGTNWISNLNVSITPDYDLHDNDFGVFQTRPRSGWPTIVKSHEWLSKSKKEATGLRGFFARRKGRLAPVWMPTGTSDFKLLSDVVQTDSSLHVVDNGYGQLVDGHPARKHVLIQLRGGVNLVCEIDNVTPRGDGSADLTLTEQVGRGIAVSQVRRISYLGLYRLASDAVTISHKTTEASVVQTSLQLTRPGNP